VSTSLLPEYIDDPLRARALRDPQAVALITPERTLTYAALDRRASATGQHLRALGYNTGDRLAWYLPTGWRAVVLLIAAIRAGIVACPLNTRVPPKGIAALLNRIQARTLVNDEVGLAEEIGGGVVVVATDDLMQNEEERAGLDSKWTLAQPATVVFTSGSSGVPKAALHSLGNHVFNALGSNENMALAPGDRWLLALPLYHVGGLGIIFRCLLAGATMVVPEQDLDLGEAIERYDITHVSLVATQLRRLLRSSPALPKVKAMLLGGSAIPSSLLAEAFARGWPVHTTYGLTEMASQVTTTPPSATLDQLHTSGWVLPYRQIKVDSDGEILVQGATLFQGYLGEEMVRQPFDEAGWFHTGDVGWLDEDGALHVQGRTDNLFISGGENIQPEEIERVLCTLPGVEQAIVVPVADAVFGQRPVAFVRSAHEGVRGDALAEQLAALLPRFKIPVAFYSWPPLDEGMKVSRDFFRQQAEMLGR
jgi:O-succinylbenzoic acid--CoA ligase